ncbi:MAG: bifunctional (p)ppGpp synthetase/guanosine-3',5'-bis(diphosphate) 3'-pyrophosphohydrolase [Bacteroidales bacterium]|nr:bifunctional (p)ppGpp synthetase/guanosine-3',5'-bis(diphosphate) 3'-pyrophosphohydrolase [Bacteroidales bacterium]
MSDIQTLYQEAIKFAAHKHMENNQKVKGSELPYVVHLSNVAMEIILAAPQTDGFSLSFAVQVALLHDTLEDTSTTYEELSKSFGSDIAEAVLALTKDQKIPRALQTTDSLARIKKLRKEVWAVKLADRITNLQSPPAVWDKEKRTAYNKDAMLILEALKEGNKYLADRLEKKIVEYDRFIGG